LEQDRYAIGDVQRLRQMLINIMNNAVKFTNHGSVILSVTRQHNNLSSNNEQSLLPPSCHGRVKYVFCITDTGCGIPTEMRDAIFEPFIQASASPADVQGTGLGLYIVRKLAEAFGGSVTVTNNVPVGSVFTLEVYLQPCNAPPSSLSNHKNDSQGEAVFFNSSSSSSTPLARSQSSVISPSLRTLNDSPMQSFRSITSASASASTTTSGTTTEMPPSLPHHIRHLRLQAPSNDSIPSTISTPTSTTSLASSWQPLMSPQSDNDHDDRLSIGAGVALHGSHNHHHYNDQLSPPGSPSSSPDLRPLRILPPSASSLPSSESGTDEPSSLSLSLSSSSSSSSSSSISSAIRLARRKLLQRASQMMNSSFGEAIPVIRPRPLHGLKTSSSSLSSSSSVSSPPPRKRKVPSASSRVPQTSSLGTNSNSNNSNHGGDENNNGHNHNNDNDMTNNEKRQRMNHMVDVSHDTQSLPLPSSLSSASSKNTNGSNGSTTTTTTATRNGSNSSANMNNNGVVLVVEDVKVNREIITKMLNKLGWRAQTAKDGSEAVQLCSQNVYHTILMDCQMPVMNAYHTPSFILRY
jgi:hypothetical protein